jgi:hypothetical protein
MREKEPFRSRWSVIVLGGLLWVVPAWSQVPSVNVPRVPGVPPYNPNVVPVPPPMLGVNIDTAPLWNGYAWETGVRVVNVWPGYPAYGRLDPGDIVTRINGYRTRSLQDFRYAMSLAGGVVNLRVRDVRTGQIVDIPPIYLYAAGGEPAAAAAAAPGAPGVPGAPSPTAPGMPGVPSPTLPGIPNVPVPTPPAVPNVPVPTPPAVPGVRVPTPPAIPGVRVPSVPGVPGVPGVPAPGPGIP